MKVPLGGWKKNLNKAEYARSIRLFMDLNSHLEPGLEWDTTKVKGIIPYYSNRQK